MTEHLSPIKESATVGEICCCAMQGFPATMIADNPIQRRCGGGGAGVGASAELACRLEDPVSEQKRHRHVQMRSCLYAT